MTKSELAKMQLVKDPNAYSYLTKVSPLGIVCYLAIEAIDVVARE